MPLRRTIALGLGLLALVACCQSSSSPPDGVGGVPIPPELERLDPAACPPAYDFDGRGFDPAYVLPRGRDALDARLFPLLAILAGDAATRASLARDPTWASLAERATTGVATARGCAGAASCVAASLLPAAADAEAAKRALIEVSGAEAFALVGDHVLPSGAFMRFAGRPPAEVLAGAWDDAFARLGELAASYPFALPAERLAPLVEQLASSPAGGPLWFEPLERLVVAGLRADGRDEAVRYEPLDDGENAAARARMATTRWSAYRFGAIVVPGQGPEDPEVALSPLGAQRCDVAVERWRAGLAPFLVTSGGHVHPDRTRYAEAIEMKRYLMEKHGVPEDAILVDPYARHTTTNIRNSTRMLLHDGMPPDTAVLVTSDVGQSWYMAWLLKPRCERELGYVPWRGGAALGATDACIRSSPEVLYLDANDPLDP